MLESGYLKKLFARHTGGLVLAFHDIDPQRFEALVDSLWALRPVHLDEIVSRSLRGKTNAGLYSITVDDGVGQTVRNIIPVLEARQWPASFYLPTRYIDTGQGMMFQLLRKLVVHLPSSVISLSSRQLDLRHAGAAAEFVQVMESSLHTQQQEACRPLVEELTEWIIQERGVPREALAPPRPITWDEVSRYGRNELVHFESHGVSHDAMSALDETRLRDEMKTSRDLVTEHTGRTCRHLAYPYGSHRSIGTLARRLAREFYSSAVTMTLGYADGADPWMLPRIPFYGENSVLRARMKVALKGMRFRENHALLSCEQSLAGNAEVKFLPQDTDLSQPDDSIQ